MRMNAGVLLVGLLVVGSTVSAEATECARRVRFVRFLYQCVLGRVADGPGLAFWTSAQNDGPGLYRAFYRSGEFAARGLSDEDFVANHYACLLRSPHPDQEGLAFWVERLQQGMPRADMVEAFLVSPEYQENYSEAIRFASRRCQPRPRPVAFQWWYTPPAGRADRRLPRDP